MSGDAVTYPKRYVSQMPPQHNGSGWADCFQAALGAYAYAAGDFTPGTNDETILNTISLVSRGTPDAEDNEYTTLAQAEVGLKHYGFPVNLSYSFPETMNAPWGILLVDGTMIRRADGSIPYPPSWFGKAVPDTVRDPDHFIVWGPPFGGAYNWIMNPLDQSSEWRQYDIDSLRSAFSCAYLLPIVPRDAPQPSLWWAAKRRFGILTKPQHGSTAVAMPVAGQFGKSMGQTRMVGKELWQYVQFTDKYGWCPQAYLKLYVPSPENPHP